MALTKRKLSVVPSQENALSSGQTGPDGNGHGPGDDHLGTADMSVGATLRQARQIAGYSLRDVATLLRLRLVYLEAIEDGRYDALPGPTYAVGFVRTYAELLGQDADEIVRRFKSEVSGIDHQSQLVFPAPAPEGRMPGGALILIAVLLAGMAYGGWYYLSSNNYQMAELIPALPDRFAALLEDTPLGGGSPAPDETEIAATETGSADGDLAASGTATGTADGPPQSAAVPAAAPTVAAPASGTATPTAATSQAPGAPAPLAAAPTAAVQPPAPASGTATAPEPALAGEATATDMVPPPAEPAQTTVAALPETAIDLPPPPPPPTAADDAAAGGVRVVLRAVADSWVQVRDAQGNLVMTRVLQPGDEYAVPDTPGLRLVTGNAGGLDVIVDGQSIPRLGEQGDVVRNILLDPDRLRSGTAAN